MNKETPRVSFLGNRLISNFFTGDLKSDFSSSSNISFFDQKFSPNAPVAKWIRKKSKEVSSWQSAVRVREGAIFFLDFFTCYTTSKTGY